MSKPDGEALIALAGKGGSAKLCTEFEEGWFRSLRAGRGDQGARATSSCCCTATTIPGTSASATMPPVMLHARGRPHAVAQRDKLERSVRIAWWPGHSTGRFAGSTWYADEFALDLARNCLAHLNCDSPGCRDATDYHLIPWMAENAGFVRGVVRDAAGKDAEGRRPTQSSDFSFNNLGITGFFSSSSRIPKQEIEKRGYYYVMGNGGNLEWHTNDDLMPVAEPRCAADRHQGLCAGSVPPRQRAVAAVGLARAAKEFDGTLAALRQGGRRPLRPRAGARPRSTRSTPRSRASPRRSRPERIAPPAANEVLLELSHLLVPLNYHPRHALAARSRACRRRRSRRSRSRPSSIAIRPRRCRSRRPISSAG